MATGIISIAAWDFELPALSLGLFAFNLVAYALLAALTVLRALRYPRLFFTDMTDHRLGPGFFTAVAGSCILGAQLLLIAHSLAAATFFLALGIVLWIGLTYTIFTAFTVKRDKPSLEHGITGAWLIAVVATQSVAVLAALIARDWPQPHRLELNFFALSMWLWGGMFYIWIISLIFYRYSFFTFSPSDLTPPYWINMGAMAISTLAGARLVENTPDAPFLASLLPFLKGFTVFYWARGDVVDSDAARARRMAPRYPAVPASLRSVVLGGGVPLGNVQRRHAANGDGAGSAVSGSAAVGDVLGGACRMDARLRGIVVGVAQDRHTARPQVRLTASIHRDRKSSTARQARGRHSHGTRNHCPGLAPVDSGARA
jgi:tellurite resistance protein TehA-like permease